MKDVQITLPDDLARDAAKMLRKSNLRKAMDRMAETTSGPAMSPDDVTVEMAKFRAERRAGSC